MIKRLQNVLWASVILLSPFYFFPSGSPQIADYLVVVLAISLVISGKLYFSPWSARILRVLLLFVLYVTVVNFVWAGILGNERIMRIPLFYVFNFLLFALVVVMHKSYGDDFLRKTTILVAITAVLQVVMSGTFASPGSFRQTLGFNNPNQLGYYSLLGACIFMMGAKRFAMTRVTQSLVLGCFLYLAALSLSKAALLGVALMLVLTLLDRPGVLILVLIACLTFVMYTESGNRVLRNVMFRMDTFGIDADDSLAGRGYDRIWNHPEYIVLGAGEGAVDRFNTRLKGGELHSTWGTVLFSYGLIGLGLFLNFLRRLWKLSGKYFLYTVPAWIYGLTHQGLRFTTLWLLLALVACFGDQKARETIPSERVSQKSSSPSVRQLLPYLK